ncbi:hypothetical protein M8C21_027787 [Ambrosia artemisiifolia]|uniref:Replication factor A C-terminal domain-containing protein n=1 Tax=Ambrosia artemisiifolia TaxID=4212 RepID=A0AAD5D3I1_AMBAR|nr:hypothetical protein M8C21_027787 [Ambrosia artemisiifolia]
MPSVPHPASLKFGKRATFTPLDNQDIPTCYYNFATYDELAPRMILPKLLTDYVGRVEHVTPIGPRARMRLRKVTIQDERRNEIEVTLWVEKAELIKTENIIGQIFVITAAIVIEFNTQTTTRVNNFVYCFLQSVNPRTSTSHAQMPPLAACQMPLNHITIAELKDKIKKKAVQHGQFTCTANITTMFEYRGWFYANCPKCPKRVCLDDDQFVCLDDDIDEEPLFMYCLNAIVKDDTDEIEVVFFNEVLTDVMETSCRDMVLARGNKNPKVLPEDISSKKGQPKLLHIAVKKDGKIVVNKAQEPNAMQPATPDPKNEEPSHQKNYVTFPRVQQETKGAGVRDHASEVRTVF